MRASSRSGVDPFIVMDVLKAAQAAEVAGRDVVHMEVGQPGTGAPEAARRAVADAMAAGPLGYTEGLGLPSLRARIARLYAEWYGVDLDPARVVVTAGSSAGFLLTFTGCFDAGQRVGLGLPGYPSYRAILKALSLDAVGIETEAPAYRVPAGAVAGLDGLIVASPGNPTGTMLDRDGMEEIVAACRAAGTTLVSDEIYHGLHHAHRAVSALEITDDAVVVNSFSKYFSMTGWRVGWLVVPDGMVRTFERLAQNMFICAPHASQVAALAAMDATEELEANRAVYAANRALMLERLPAAGLDRIGSPDGAFYVYADVSHLTDDSRAFCAELLEAGVAATPGLDFDPARGHRTVRFSYARSTEEVARGLDRIAAFVAGRAAA